MHYVFLGLICCRDTKKTAFSLISTHPLTFLLWTVPMLSYRSYVPVSNSYCGFCFVLSTRELCFSNLHAHQNCTSHSKSGCSLTTIPNLRGLTPQRGISHPLGSTDSRTAVFPGQLKVSKPHCLDLEASLSSLQFSSVAEGVRRSCDGN